jgi:hypothetical protein
MGLFMLAMMSVVVAYGQENARPFTDAFVVDSKDLSPTGRNPYFILEPGYQLVLQGREGGENIELTITVLQETKKIGDIETRVVEEKETANGKVKESSKNYFAISKGTNSVYYLGEDVGKAWVHGEKGAQIGLFMPGLPLLGSRHYQEIAPGVAMDRAEIVGLSETVETAAGRFEKCLKVEETTPLEPGNKEYKLYAPGVGLVQEGELKLVKYGQK